MSINSMSSLAYSRRSDVHPVPTAPVAPALPSAGGGNAAHHALGVVTAFIPTEALTLYLVAYPEIRTAYAEHPGLYWIEWGVTGAFIVLVPLLAWLLYAGRVKSAGKPLPLSFRSMPLFEMMAGSVAFVAWSALFEHSPIAAALDLPGALLGVAAFVLATLLVPAQQVFHRPLAAE